LTGRTRSGRRFAAGATSSPTSRGRPITSCRCSPGVLFYAVDPLGKIAGNPREGIKQLHTADRSEIIWTAVGIAQLKNGISERDPPRPGRGPRCAHRPAAWRPAELSWPHVGSGCHHPVDRQEPRAPRSDHSDLRRLEARSGRRPEAINRHPDQQLRRRGRRTVSGPRSTG
jgi:hypothetical protein